jgi:hypothetical protein
MFRCNKKGGVCTLALYERTGSQGTVTARPGTTCTTCPNRFYEKGMVFRWIGETILETPEPVVLGPIPFLQRELSEGRDGKQAVGEIDHVLVRPEGEPLCWCALEIQAVYFSGDSMRGEFQALGEATDASVPFPRGHRRPDFRSSGPKRLMPQLQIKVPALRRWGKRMAVVVDAAFFGAMSPMETVSDLSNCDIAWFVVRYAQDGAETHLRADSVHLTTLERAVEGLTAGRTVDQRTFEQTIRARLAAEATSRANQGPCR